jgi:hypothetical protein
MLCRRRWSRRRGDQRPRAPRRAIGTALDLRVGYGDRVTHAIVVEPNPNLSDTGSEIASWSPTSIPEERSSSLHGEPDPVHLRAPPDIRTCAARAVKDAGRELFLHLPMEPRGPRGPRQGRDPLDLSRVEIEERISRSLGTPRGIDPHGERGGERPRRDARRSAR